MKNKMRSLFEVLLLPTVQDMGTKKLWQEGEVPTGELGSRPYGRVPFLFGRLS